MELEINKLGWMIRRLYRIIGVLAMPAEHQVEWLRQIKTYPSADELALDFDDCFRTVPTLLDAKLMSESEQVAISQIDQLFAEMSDDKSDQELWYAEGVLSDSRWEEIRRLAREFLFTEPSPAPQ